MSLRAGFCWTAASRLTYAFSQWLALALVARFASTQQLGEFAYALAFVGPIIVFAQLNMRGFMATDATTQFGFSDYLGTQLFTIAAAMLVIAGAAAWMNKGGVGAALLLLVGAFKSIESVSGIYYGAMQRNERMREIGISVIAHGLSAVAMMAAALILSGSVAHGAIGTAVAWLAILLAYDARVAPASVKVRLCSEINLARIWAVMACCLPLGVVVAMLTLRFNIPAYFVKAELGAAQVGVYSIIAYFMVAGNMITGSLLQVVAPRFTNYYRDQRRDDTRRLIMKMMGIVGAIGAAGILGAWALGSEVLSLLYGQKFETQWEVLVWVMVASAIMYVAQLFGLVLTVLRSFRQQILSNSTGIFAVTLFSVWLVPYSGLIGAAQALCAGALATCLANVIAVYLLRPALLFRPLDAESGRETLRPKGKHG